MHALRIIFNCSPKFKPRLVEAPLKHSASLQASIMTTNNNNNHTSKLTLDAIETCKARAAWAAVDDYIDRDCIVGIGSGSTMRYVLERMKHICQERDLSVKCIPTSFQSKQLIYEHGLALTELEANPAIGVTIDGADEVDENFVAIKGGGACLSQEKVIAFAADKFVVVADYRKNSKHLCDKWTKGIPIEVLPMAGNAVRHYMARKFKTKLSSLQVRIGKEKAGPVITDNGNFVIDWKFEQTIAAHMSAPDWKRLSDEIKVIPGVVETGIFANMVKAVYFGLENETVLKKIAASDI